MDLCCNDQRAGEQRIWESVICQAKALFDAALLCNILEFRGFCSALEKARKHNEWNKIGKFKKQQTKCDPLTWQYLADAWAISSQMI